MSLSRSCSRSLALSLFCPHSRCCSLAVAFSLVLFSLLLSCPLALSLKKTRSRSLALSLFPSLPERMLSCSLTRRSFSLTNVAFPLSRSLFRFPAFALSYSLPCSLFLSPSRSRSLLLSSSLSCSLALALSRSLALSLSCSCALAVALSRSHALALALSLSLSLSLLLSLFPFPLWDLRLIHAM